MIAYTYVGYPLYLFLRSRVAPRPARSAPVCPPVSIVIASHNDALSLRRKLRNLADLDYPKDHYEVIVVSDGSTDDTISVLQEYSSDRVKFIVMDAHRGKAVALQIGAQAAESEIIVFTDTRQILVREALRHLVSQFADSNVGAVSGELLLGQPDSPKPDGEGVGLYWRIEQYMRKWEGAIGSVVGVLGAFYGVRRSLYLPPPEGAILDDLFVALNVCRQGARVVYDPRARVWDDIQNDLGKEFQRKVRTLTGNYQLLQMAPWVLTPKNKILFNFVSHKLMRLFVPFWLIAVFVSSLLLTGSVYRLFLALQIVLYALSAVAYFAPDLRFGLRLSSAALTFVMLNVAAVVAFVNFINGKKEVWVK